MTLRPKDRWPLGAVGFILAVSGAWWGFALFAVPGAPEWLDRARAVCFNITETGLPDPKGWLLLLGQPPAMLALLYAGWGTEVRGALGRLAASTGGRRLLGGTALVVMAGLALAGIRVAGARIPPPVLPPGFGPDAAEALPETYPRLDRPWPGTPGLVDQRGEPFSLKSLGGRRAFVTFAFGHCKTICPLVVHNSRRARLVAERETAVAVFTLDPWRDTPGRLPVLAAQFGLDPERDFVVGGPVEEVNAALDAFGMARERDPRTGDMIHPSLVYLVERDGTLAYGSTGAASHLVQLAARLR